MWPAYCWSIVLKNIEDLKKEIKQALIYFEFWNYQRHPPTAAESADYFSTRLKRLGQELNGKHQLNNTHRESGRLPKTTSDEILEILGGATTD